MYAEGNTKVLVYLTKAAKESYICRKTRAHGFLKR